MPEDDSVEKSLANAKTGMEVVGQIIKAAGDSPEVKQAGKNLGQTAVIITETVNNVLLPLALLNYPIRKAKEYFQSRFEQELIEKTGSIPSEHLVEPKASVAGPALQGLAFTHEEPNLKEMYLNLLATALDGRVAENAHPAFVEVIRQLSSDEATLLRDIYCQLESRNSLPTLQIYLSEDYGNKYKPWARHYMNVLSVDASSLASCNLFARMIENLVRLGLIKVYEKSLDYYEYSWVGKRGDIDRLEKNAKDGLILRFEKGMLEPSAFGRQFAHAVGLNRQDCN